MSAKLKLAVWKFSSCDGCQLSLLDCEDEILAVAGAVDLAYFLEVSSAVKPGPYDLSLVEGSILTAHDQECIRQVRTESKLLVAMGACAVSGGLQALRNFADLGAYLEAVYPHPEQVDTLATSSPVSDHVEVDLILRGCPVNKEQLLEVVVAVVQGRKPDLVCGSVCLECKRAGHPCLLVSGRAACLGPVTEAGCGALCPSYGRGCYGCFGPREDANTASLRQVLESRLGLSDQELGRVFRGINCNAPAFALGNGQHEDQH
jgi:coenzyme F420-reducing hydrogenase gamma subunit